MYEMIGRAVVRYGFAYVKRRYRTQLITAAALGGVAAIAGAYFASRSVEEG